MGTKVFSLAGVAALGGFVWMGCSGSVDNKGTPPVTNNDGGPDGSPGTTPDGVGGPGNGDGGKDGGGIVPTPGVKVTYGKCPAFQKCDSDPVGSWTVTGGCLSDAAFTAAKVKCPGLKEHDVAITAEGTAEITATHAKRDATVYFQGSATIPKSCAPIPIDCGLIEGVLRGEYKELFNLGDLQFDEANCSEAGESCECTVKQTIRDNTDADYTKSNGTLTTASRTFDYCAKENSLRYTETTNPDSPLKFVVDMSK